MRELLILGNITAMAIIHTFLAIYVNSVNASWQLILVLFLCLVVQVMTLLIAIDKM